MSDEVLSTVGSIAALLLFGSVAVLTIVIVKQTGLVPHWRPDPPGTWQRVVKWAWLGIALSIAMIIGAFWSTL